MLAAGQQCNYVKSLKEMVEKETKRFLEAISWKALLTRIRRGFYVVIFFNISMYFTFLNLYC